MSEQPSPPPKAKPGSLRDRIAAFEKSSTPAPGPTPPPPRPKPAGFASWRPRAASPPPGPPEAGASSTSAVPKVNSGGMSASDAKESITKGGSLKDRMAALQGKGAFGAPSPPIAPKPALEKPKWKPPPVVAAPPPDEDGDNDDDDDSKSGNVEVVRSPPVEGRSYERSEEEAGEEQVKDGEEQTEDVSVDPEEEERQRRAAIAARMAKLGGARLGMAPPVFAKKPVAKKNTEEEEKPQVKADVHAEHENITEAPVSSPPVVTSSPLDGSDTLAQPSTDSYFPKRRASDSTSLLSVESVERGSPSSMPVPAVPRRAGPPRRKPAKAPVPSAPDVDETTEGDARLPTLEESEKKPEEVDEIAKPSTDEVTASALVEEIEVDPEDQVHNATHILANEGEGTQVHAEPTKHITEDYPAAEESQHATIDPELHTVAQEEPEAHPVSEEPEAQPVAEEPEGQALPETIAHNDEETQEDEETRQKRIAERLARMGGVNPFALPAQRTISSDQEDREEDGSQSVPTPLRSPSLQRSPSIPVPRRTSSIPVPQRTSSIPVPQRSPSIKKGSVGSIERKASIDSTTVLGGTITEDPELNKTPEIINKSQDSTLTKSPEPAPTPEVTEPKADKGGASEDGNERRSDETTGAAHDTAYQTYNEAEHVSHATERSDAAEVDFGHRHSTDQHPQPVMRTLTKEPDDFEQESNITMALDTHHPPRRVVPQTPEADRAEELEEQQEYEEEYGDTDDDGEPSESDLAASTLFVPPPRPYVSSGSGSHVQRQAGYDSTGDDEAASAPLPIPHRRSLQVSNDGEGAPPPPPSRYVPRPPTSDGGDDSDYAVALPTRPRVVPAPSPPPVPMASRPAAPPAHAFRTLPSPSLGFESLTGRAPTLTRSLSSSDQEILDDEEGDPIDPAFHSPSRRGSNANLRDLAVPVPVPVPTLPPVLVPEVEEDPESSRRRTIAERMAKLGGIKFGAAPVPTPAALPPPATPREAEDGNTEAPAGEDLTEEEEERARKERISAKLAGMGGMRIGMMPLARPQRSHTLKDNDDVSTSTPPAPPQRAPPPPQPQEVDSERESAPSDDGVKVEADESEIEELTYDEPEEEPEPVPPPVPTRGGKQSSVPQRRESSDVGRQSQYRPPVPSGIPARKPSLQATSPTGYGREFSDAPSPPQRRASTKVQSEYVLVDEPTEEAVPAPPARPTGGRAPPRRAVPPPAAPEMNMNDSISSQWELPVIPSSALDFGGGGSGDLSLSWSEDSEFSGAPPHSSASSAFPEDRTPMVTAAAMHAEEVQMSSEALMAVWGRVGVQICEVATALHDKSRKVLVGDGSYAGFVAAVFKEVPNAARINGYGYLVYAQAGNSVQTRVSEIMPGDVVELVDAKLKGHKGLQTYHQNVGVGGEHVVGVVSEFEPKKSKIRVFQANQHVGQQTVEAVSYRLEDLKSGTVKVYRVLEA